MIFSAGAHAHRFLRRIFLAGISLGLVAGAQAESSITLYPGDAIVADAGSNDGTSGVFYVAASTGNRIDFTGFGAEGEGAVLDTPQFVVVAPNGLVYYIEALASGTLNQVIAVSPTNHHRTAVTSTPFTAPTGMAWDYTTGMLIVSDAGSSPTTAALFSVNPSSGAETVITSSTVGSGPAINTPRFPAVGPTGAIYYIEATLGSSDQVIFVNAANGNRTTLASSQLNAPTGMSWDFATGLLVVSVAGTSNLNSGIMSVNPSNGNSIFITGDSISGEGANIDTPESATATSPGVIYYYELVASPTANNVIQVSGMIRGVLSGSDGPVGAGTAFVALTSVAAIPDVATHFSVSAPGSAVAGGAITVTVTALDNNNNVATGYAGSVHFTSSDGVANLPGNSILTSGTGTFSVTLNTSGAQTITVSDSVTSSESGTSGSIATTTTSPNLYWTDTSTGNRVIWLMNGTSYGSSVALGNVATSWEIDGTGDFGGDGNIDILWTNTTTGERVIWLMSGNTVSSSVSLGVVATNWIISGVADFNGDGKPDILFTNTTTGERVIWLMNGTSYGSSVSLGVVPAYWSISGVADFNEDGSPDILFRNTTTGEGLIWLMDGTTHTLDESIGIIPAELRISAIADYNGDGSPDLLMTNAVTDERVIWLMNGYTHASTVSLGVVPSNWELYPSGLDPVELAKLDFNGDGQPDILFENTTTGDLYVWLMNGTTFSSSVFIGNVAPPWQIVGTGDFAGTGNADLLWMNTSTGEIVIWLMNGTSFVSGVSVGAAPAGWTINAVGDFNGDGSPDILFTNTTTGERVIWLMSGTSFSSSVSLGILTTQWRIADTGDFYGEGQPDIVFQNMSTGDCVVWLMNGTTVEAAVDLGNPGTQWQLQAAEDFTGAGQPDLVFENTSTGDRYIWLMNGTTFESSVYLGNVGTQWQIRN